jgi:Tol biopolymer transport system component
MTASHRLCAATLAVACPLVFLLGVGAPASAAATDEGSNQLVALHDGTDAQAGDPSSINGTAAVASRGGRFVTFATRSALVPEDDNGHRDVYVRDTLTRRTTLVSVTPDGRVGNGDSSQPTISSSGTQVAFTTAATNLVPDRNGSALDVVAKDLYEDVMWGVSARTDGTQADANSFAPVFSGDGSVVVFASLGRLARKDDDASRDVYAHSESGRTWLVSVGERNRNFTAPARVGDVSYDGFWIVFGNGRNVWLRDVLRFRTRSVWHEPGPGSVGRPSISGDGRFAAFSTSSTTIMPGERGHWSDIFRVNLATGKVARVVIGEHGGPGNEDSFSPSLSYSGRFVAFSSYAGNLSPLDGVDNDVFLRDMRSPASVLISRAVENTPNGVSGGREVAIDDSGTAVVFTTYASDLVENDVNDVADVMLWSR